MKQYFASKQVNELLPELADKIKKFFDYKERIGESRRWKKSYDLYYGDHVESGDNSEVSFVGDDGELTAYGINYYRNLVKHVLAITCSEKPSYDYRAKNTDLESLQQARLADSIVESYLVEKRMGRHMKQAAERALVFKEGFTFMQWDTSAGKALMPVPVLNPDGTPKVDSNGIPFQKIQHEGDPSAVSKSPWEVIRDINLRDWVSCKWTIVKDYENKYDLATRHPDKAEDILKLSSNCDESEFQIKNVIRGLIQEDDSDIIPVWHFYHLPTDSMPAGRYTKFITSSLHLYDGAYPYSSKSGNHKLPVQRITPGERFDTTDGYSEFNDLMVLQQVINVLMSSVFTNQQVTSVPIIWMPDGVNIAPEQLQGLAILKGGPPGSEPKAIQLTATPSEVFKNVESVKGAMTELSGLNSVITGAESKDLSGAAIGRYQSMAIQFSSNFQQSWAELQEDNGTFLLHLLQNFANTKRITAMAGKSNKGAMKAWTGKDIDQIERLVCDLGNPAFRTFSGRIDTADKLLDKGLIKDPTQYMQLIKTGNIDPMFESPLSKLELIRKENEILMEGGQVRAMVGDTHIQHAQEHRVILDDPYIRSLADQGDPLALKILQNTTDHIMEHKDLNTNQDMFWFAVSGEQPPPPPMMPPPGPAGAPPPQGGNPGPDPSILPDQEMQQPPGAPPIPPVPPGV